jgi:hypothetical protein
MILLLLACCACGDAGFPPPIPKTQAVLAAFADEPQTGPVRAAGEARRLHLYVDASGSMKGFVGRPSSDYSRVLTYLLDDAATAGYDLSAFGFANRISAPLGNVGAETILKPGFYSGGETSFPDLFERIVREYEEGAVSVVVSDLVQSGRTGDQRALILAFQQLARKHPEVLLLALRSSFEGRYFVEGARTGSSFFLSLDGSTAEKSRPFYIVVIAPSRSDLDEARRFLLFDLHGYEEFDASSPGLKLSGGEYLSPGDGAVPVWNVYNAAEPLPVHSAIPRSLLSFLEISPPAKSKSLLRVRFAIEDAKDSRSGGLRSPRDLGFDVRSTSWRNGKWKPAEETDIAPEALLGDGGKSLTMSYSLPRPDPFVWDLYRVRLMPGAGNLRLPDWFEEWTTLDDSLPMWGNRTLKLELFLEAMTRSLREQVPLSEHYLLLGRGE